ncbi:hypothetical protein PanWU01x14_229210 [Parasponia andersonii]|uniref:Uncharacterized protein n=1 Tax=Parasponia andersonii TaxID=3476 RepID=A0A2P5BLC4_PARAD|nr:hypothetical protein PanWU01x14_229210 [Parasponia andersonii]
MLKSPLVHAQATAHPHPRLSHSRNLILLRCHLKSLVVKTRIEFSYSFRRKAQEFHFCLLLNLHITPVLPSVLNSSSENLNLTSDPSSRNNCAPFFAGPFPQNSSTL